MSCIPPHSFLRWMLGCRAGFTRGIFTRKTHIPWVLHHVQQQAPLRHRDTYDVARIKNGWHRAIYARALLPSRLVNLPQKFTRLSSLLYAVSYVKYYDNKQKIAKKQKFLLFYFSKIFVIIFCYLIINIII